jgi:hypothetical protein
VSSSLSPKKGRKPLFSYCRQKGEVYGSTAIRHNYDYINIPSNPGYGARHNVTINKSQRKPIEYHLVMNADISSHGDALALILGFKTANKEVALMMPKVLNPDGSIQRLYKLVPTPVDLLIR